MKKLLLLLVLISTCICSNAGNRSQEEAMNIANSFLMTKNAVSISRPGQTLPEVTSLPQLSLAYKATSIDNSQNYYYVFNNQDGAYVIVPGDDMIDGILGYSESGTFDYSDIPDGMKDLLNSYQEQINSINVGENSIYCPASGCLASAENRVKVSEGK